MNDTILDICHHLPSPLRSAAASLRGLYLRSWRYGRESDRLVQEARERERWSNERWRTWQQEQLAMVLSRAATRVPYYREQWVERRRKGDHASWGVLENWPTLEKEIVRQNPNAFLADDCNVRKMFHEHTSGTTGKPLDTWWSRETVQMFYALSEARWRLWYGVSKQDAWAVLGGQLVTSVAQRKPPFWVWNAALNQLYMSSYHLAPDLVPNYLDAIRKHRVKYIFGYCSSLYAIAAEVIRQRVTDLRMEVAITNAEPLLPHQRQTIAKAFQCPVRETYGLSEIVTSGGECGHGVLHLWPELGYVEILQGNQPLGNGSIGELVCTSLLNKDMPLIRYRVGDRASLETTALPCKCGRNLPVLAGLDGRIDDVLYTSDGRRVGRLDPVFKTQLPLSEAQIIQETLKSVRVRYVSSPGFTQETARLIKKRLQDRMGAVEVILDSVTEIPRGPNGKFQSVICRIPPEDRKALEGS